ncbi:MAG: uroporphyrinogen decarboxylase family protein, partial [Clostridia bacterium]|nr:uroporphyrinogen decarboxylase family protein [Clostridia bacterium]
GRLPVILDAVRKVKERLGDKVSVSASVTGPLSIAAMVVGTENLLIGMIKKPQQVHQLMEVIVENNNRLIKRLVEMGVGIGFPDPVSSTALISVEQYRKFSLPYFKRNVDYVKSLGGGCGLHICGTSRKLWEDLRETGIGAFSLDNVEDLEEAKRVLGGKMGIQGNVPPVDVMKLGTPHDVLRSARECIRKGWDSPNGFTLTSGCQMPAGTPEENMQALMDAARIFGRYPLDKSLLED